MEKRGQACYLYVNWLNLSALIQFAETGAVQTGAVQTGAVQTGLFRQDPDKTMLRK